MGVMKGDTRSLDNGPIGYQTLRLGIQDIGL